MKKLSRRELFLGAGIVAVGGAALVVGLRPAKAALPGIGACSRVGKSLPGLYPTWTPTIYLPSHIPDFGEVPMEVLQLYQKAIRKEGFACKIGLVSS